MPGSYATKSSQDPPPPVVVGARTLPILQPALPAPGPGLDRETGEVGAGGEVPVGQKRSLVPRIRPSVADAMTATYRSLLDPEYVIGPADDRVIVTDTRAAPWRHVCALRIRLKDGHTLSGTGWFIGPRTIVTAGHCVFPHIRGSRTDPDYRYDDWADRIEIYPAADGVGADGEPRSPVKMAVSSDFTAPEGWWRSVDEELDFGAIFVKKPPPDWAGLGWFSFGAYGDADLERSVVSVSGYPSDKTLPGEVGRQWTCAQKVVRVSHRRIYYEVDTFGGQSGSPVFIELPSRSGRRFAAVGIHNYGDRRGVANSGARITPELFATMKMWKQQGT